VLGIGSEPMPPGAKSASPIMVRAGVGYTLEGPRSELFAHSLFRDFTVKVLAKRGGKIVRIADVKIDRRLIPRLTEIAGRP
jgi:hypothetical protein